MSKFNIFLQKLGFSESDISEKEATVFTYLVEINETKYEKISFVYAPTNDDIYKNHKLYWNQNETNSFIAVGDKMSFLINAKAKPDFENPIGSNILISTFDYGVNSEGFEKEKIEKITKEYIDSTYFFDFVSKELSRKKKQEVDKDLLLNLIRLRNDLLESSNDEDSIHLLILRCLFIKYLEDKGIYEADYLVKILNTQDTTSLVNAFEEIKRINGDIFKIDKIDIEQKINVSYLAKLHLFFTTDYGKSNQLRLFPYQFDQIPIQLISHVYEAFLNSDEKKGKGIYYTPAFFVNFILSHTLIPKLESSQNITVLDPSVGSGSFLIESFRAIVKSHKQKIDFAQKKEILQNQLFGIDIDPNALQIAAFSLYLALIETEDPLFIREQIKNASPILPSLIGYNLFHKNSLTDAVFEDKTFDCIVSNPPWGSVEPNDDVENVKERAAIGTKSKGKSKGRTGLMPEYKNVADYERSQAFLIRVKKWCNEQTIVSLIVKNSIFLNGDSEDFRKELVNLYQINHFYELSDYNKILFEKRTIGKIKGKPVEIGASEPCAVLVFELPKADNYTIKYIAPKINEFAENFQLIHFTQKDINLVEKNRFEEDDLVWRVLVRGDFEDYKLIRNLLQYKLNDKEIDCNRGFAAEKNMELTSSIEWNRLLLKSEDIARYRITNSNLPYFNWNQKLPRRRTENLYVGDRILLAYRPTPNDKFRLRSIHVNKDIIFRNDMVRVKIKDVINHNPYVGILNSSLASFFIFKISSQWDGGLKREALRLYDIKALPFIKEAEFMKHPLYERLCNLVNQREKAIEEDLILKIDNEIDELVFDIYSLKEYEKEIIREFYQIKVERAAKEQKFVRPLDIEKYAQKFVEVFSLMLEKDNKLVATRFKISLNIGTAICFRVVEDTIQTQLKEDKTLEILNFVKNNQIKKADFSKILNEDKVKIYDNKLMYIVKSNLYKDWTIRQAIKDAREEINLILSNLPETNG